NSIANEWSKSDMLYRIVEDRPNGYQALKNALELTRQTGALDILQQIPDNSDPPPGSDEHGSISGDAEADTLETPREILALFKNQLGPQNPLVVNVRKPTSDEKVQLEKSKYKLRNAYAFILNIVRFDGHFREGAHVDSANMTKLLEELEFQIYPEERFRNLDYKSKEDIKTHLDVFREKCVEDQVDCLLIFFGSHGYNDKVYTSDSETLDIYLDVIYKFQFTEEEINKRVAKIFINNSCQSDQPFGDLNERPGYKEPDVTDTLYIKAQMTKYPANRDPEFGSYFVFVFTCVLMRNAYNKSLMEMLTQVQKYLKILSKKDEI
ncbi:Caspase, partial [Orchesella cincta]